MAHVMVVADDDEVNGREVRVLHRQRRRDDALRPNALRPADANADKDVKADRTAQIGMKRSQAQAQGFGNDELQVTAPFHEIRPPLPRVTSADALQAGGMSRVPG